MFPSVQIGEETRDSHGFRSVYMTDDNNFLWLNLDDVFNLDLIENTKKNRKIIRRKQISNKIKIINKIQTSGFGDIRKFKKKDNYLICSFE